MKTSCCHSKKVLKENDYFVCMNSCCENYMHPVTLLYYRKWNNIFLFFFFIFIFILTFNDFSYNTVNNGKFKLNKFPSNSTKVLNEENLLKEINSNHIICPEQVFAQILIESGHLNSYLVIKANNLLGMRYPFKRLTSAIGIFLPASNQIIKGKQAELKKYKNQNNYAVYQSWEDCIKDYKYWQDKSFKLTERYLLFLGNCYAEDSLYVKKIIIMAKKKQVMPITINPI